MKIGIFLGYGPQVKLGKEGLGRYIGGLIKGFQEQEHEVVIACPFWLKDNLNDLMCSFSVDKRRVVFVTTNKLPPLWIVYDFIFNRRSDGNIFKTIYSFGKAFFYQQLKNISTADSRFFFLMWLLFDLIVFLFMIIPVMFFCILLTVNRYIKKNAAMVRAREGIRQEVKQEVNGRNSVKEEHRALQFTSVKKWMQNIQLRMFFYMNDAVLSKLVEIVNARNMTDVWFVPALFWPQTTLINKTTVFNAPDLVSQEFSYGFADVTAADSAIEECRKTILRGKYFITYSDFLRKELLIKQYSKEMSNTISITHANNDMSPYLYIDEKINAQLLANIDLQDCFAKQVLSGISSRSVKYIFYASQIRPSKNMLNLIKAYEYLLRKKFITVKLYVTADLKKDKDIFTYITKNKLSNDIIGFYNVSAQTLAALYHGAVLVVNPTLYEGGFPFTFGEGMSVGTPSIMSDIPIVRDVLETAGLEKIMFDPYNWMEIAEKIEWALSDLKGLYLLELPLYEQVAKRNYSVVANDYIDAFKMFINTDKR